MGYLNHRSITVITYNKELAEEAHKKAVSLMEDIVTPLMVTPVNTDYTFAILPDGSKEGWQESNTYDQKRYEFMQWLFSKEYDDGSNPFDWIDVNFDEEGVITINSHNS